MSRKFESPDGLALAFYEWGDAADACPVVLQHGFAASSAANWEGPGIVGALVKAGRRVVALDARGHGKSASPHDTARYGRAMMAADISALADHLGVERYDLAGYSMGGMVGVITAARDRRVRRFAVCGCVQQILMDRARDDTFAGVTAALRAPKDADIDHPGARMFRAVAERSGGDLQALAACFEGIEVDHALSREVLPQITAPTLVIGGRKDPLMKGADTLVAAIVGAKLEWVDGDHLTAVADPQFAAGLAAFFA